MRLFLALEPDPAARVALEAVIEAVRHDCGSAARDWRWVPAGNVHLTLLFFGEVSETEAERLAGALGGSITEAPFDIETGDVAWFPSAGRPRVLWLALRRGASEAARLQAELGRRVRPRGGRAGRERFEPHLTLARARSSRPPGGRRGAGRTVPRIGWPSVTWTVRDVVLLRSHLSNAAARYEVRHRVRLAGDVAADA